ncbi:MULTISPECIES: hypothetical protein [unclassified Pseudomonas]|uniref:hypothetical protein n=1 Tax=unclassified Pseudomonas TaxID=196821 RepID=UPI002AC8A335|nr:MULTISPECIES: hypothetical protein [unclassified Pseudomonas]MEB0076092.1 hypothetical protein [Pseudomonas sp. MH10out]MEB0132047.1 hypothetical protein [Pseudomonas sp. CCI2.4]WPX30297.1 hypothetical protein RHM64_12085 [Pseudomonas sp. AH2]
MRDEVDAAASFLDTSMNTILSRHFVSAWIRTSDKSCCLTLSPLLLSRRSSKRLRWSHSQSVNCVHPHRQMPSQPNESHMVPLGLLEPHRFHWSGFCHSRTASDRVRTNSRTIPPTFITPRPPSEDLQPCKRQ